MSRRLRSSLLTVVAALVMTGTAAAQQTPSAAAVPARTAEPVPVPQEPMPEGRPTMSSTPPTRLLAQPSRPSPQSLTGLVPTPLGASPTAPSQPARAVTVAPTMRVQTSRPAGVSSTLQPTPRASREAERPMGFSVVLVTGDLRAAPGGEDDVPPAARKALADMKDFLPYKSYRLLDAAWVLCCGPGRTTTRLRGPDDKEYELEIIATQGPSARNAIQFVLRDAAGTASDDMAAANARMQDLERALAEAQKQGRTSGQGTASGGSGSSAEQEARARAVVVERQKMEEAKVRVLRAQGLRGGSFGSVRPVINTSFSMDSGETVVVGTSRLAGGDTALIALLTAVPQKSSRQP